MIKVLINNEEVVSNHNLEIKEEMLSTSSTILKNCYPKVWENDKDYVSRFYYPKDYSKCKIYNLPRENTTQEQTGTNLSFETYTEKSTLEDIKFYGDTLQNGTPTPSSPVPIQSVTGLQNIEVCGKNLLNITAQSQTKNGITFTINNDGTVVANGTATADIYLKLNENYVFKPNTYTISGCPKNGSSSKYFMYINGSKSNDYGNGATNEISTQTTSYVGIAIRRGQVCNNLTFKPQLELGSTSTEYEPYKGNTYEVNLGKNLLDITTLDYGYVGSNGSIVNSHNAGEMHSTFIKVKPNTTYTFKIFETSTTYNNWFVVGEYSTNDQSSFIQRDTMTTATQNYITFTTSATTQYVRVSARNLENATKVQLEKGSQATSYSPYFTPIELNKIGTYQDRIYKDNGKWYVEKNIGKVVLDGSETWNLAATYTNNTRFTGDNVALGKNTSLISDYFVEGTGGTDTTNIDTNGNSGKLMLTIPNSIATTTSDLITWLSTHNTTVLYQLATPTYTEITNEELINQLESLNIQLYEGQTNFIINGSLPMPTYIKIYTNFEELIFCGFTKNTGNVSLNPREFHGVDLQILDFKDLLSTGETLNYVIANKTIIEAINQVVNSISDYGFVVGEIQLLNPNEMIGAYSTLNKTAYDVFQYFAEITQSRWTTRLIDENTIAIDFYDPSLMPTGVDIDKTQTFYENYKIIDMSFNYSTNDYRNKQIMTSDEVYANITQTETIIADGYATSFMCQNKIGIITSIKLNGVERSYATKSEEQLGITADFVYQPGETTFTSNNSISAGGVIVITYYPIVKGREIILNNTESDRIESQINRNGIISRYENRNDTTSSQELQKIGQSYIKYKGNAEINLKIVSELNTWNVGEIVSYNAPISELSTTYMVKSKQISMYLNANKIIYTYNLTSNYNCENAVNYFDNQRAKSQGNIGEGETITRNIDLENKALIIFYDTEQEEIEPINPSSLDFALDGVLI